MMPSPNSFALNQPEIDFQAEFINNVISSKHDSQLFLSQLCSDSLPAKIQLGIYRRNYTGSITKTLQQIYPACERILGDEFFTSLCRDYAYAYPSRNQDLNNYGEHFKQLLNRQLETNSNLTGFEYLPDLAELEINWHRSYYASNDTVFDHAAFSALTDQQQTKVVFELSQSLSLHTSHYPVTAIWKDNCDDDNHSSEYTVPDSAIFYCIHRLLYVPSLDIVSESIALTIDAIKRKSDLGTLCSYHELNINASLPFLIQKGWITGFSIMDNQ